MTDEIEIQKPEAALSLSPESLNALSQMAEKYRRLVWYARHQSRRADPQRWMDIPTDIKKRALRVAREVEGDYPADTEALTNPDTADWTHGFNSGVLAGVRFAVTCFEQVIDQSDPDDPDSPDEEIIFGGWNDALAEFPDLDT